MQLADLKEAEMNLEQSQHTLEMELHDLQRKAVSPVVSSRAVAGSHSTPYAVPSHSPAQKYPIRTTAAEPEGAERSEFYLYGRDTQAESDERRLAERIEAAHAARQQLIQQQDELLLQQQQLLRHNAAVLAQTLRNGAAQPAQASSPTSAANRQTLSTASGAFNLPPDLGSPSVKARRAALTEPAAAYAPPLDPITSPSVTAIRNSLRDTQREWDEVDVAITGKPMSHPPSPPYGNNRLATTDPGAGVITTSEVISNGVGKGQPQIHVHVHNHLGKTDRSPVQAAAAAAAKRHFATRAAPLSPVRSTLPNSPSNEFDNLASAHELERQQQIYMSRTGRVVPSGVAQDHGSENAVLGRIRKKELALQQSEHAARAQNADAADEPDLSTYMRTFNALESKLAHSLGLPSPDFDDFAEGDLERAITLHKTRLAFDATANPDRPDGMEDRYLDHMIHQKQVLLDRLTALEVEEARTRQEERLKFELQLAEIEADARERDRWNQANGIGLQKAVSQASPGTSLTPTYAQLQSIGEALTSSAKRPPSFNEWSSSARGSIAPTSVATTQRLPVSYDPSADAHISRCRA